MQIQNKTLKLAGVIEYTCVQNLGHYRCYARRITGKWELQDGICKAKKPINAPANAIKKERRIHMLYYIQSIN